MATAGDLIQIGKPSAFHNSVDKDHRVGKFLKSRMSIIDLLPCTYKINFAAGMETGDNAAGLMPEIEYDVMKEYAKTCVSYGVNSVSGIRLYTTDSTTATDSITNSLKDNYFQSGINKMSELGRPINDFMRSVDSQGTAGITDAIVEGGTDSIVEGITGLITNAKAKAAASSVLKAAVNVVGKGYRVSLPSIWNDSQYAPNFHARVKLVSPYGHQEAIKEFIIRPLIHLLIMASPKTEDGVSYGDPYTLTIKAYGMNYTPIGMISNMTLHRGGNDSSYNVFKQPLSIDVDLDFQYLINGFAHYKHDKNTSDDSNIFGGASDYEYEGNDASTASLPTVGNIIRSLKPRKSDIDTSIHVNMDAAHNTKESSTENSYYTSLLNTSQNYSPKGVSDMSVPAAQILSDKTILSDIGSQITHSIVSGAISSALS